MRFGCVDSRPIEDIPSSTTTQIGCVASILSLPRRPPALSTNQEQSMKYVMHVLMRWIDRVIGPSADERYLAQSVDAKDFEVRIRALERRSF